MVVAVYFNQAAVDNVDTTTGYNHIYRLCIYICYQECIIKRERVFVLLYYGAHNSCCCISFARSMIFTKCLFTVYIVGSGGANCIVYTVKCHKDLISLNLLIQQLLQTT